MSKPKTITLYSPRSESIRVTLPDGGIAVIPPEPTEVPDIFYDAALRAGCRVVGMAQEPDPNAAAPSDADTKSGLIAEAIRDAQMADPTDEAYADAFTASGIPSTTWLSHKVGFNVSASERDEAWRNVLAEDDDDNANND